jgi:chromosome segregation ATPase
MMVRTEAGKKPKIVDEATQVAQDTQRKLAKAEQKIRKLQDKVADQQRQIRTLQAQAKHVENTAAEREELKSEISDLKSETRELTRANREYIGKLEALRAENVKLKAEAKVQKPSGISAGADLRGLLQPPLS